MDDYTWQIASADEALISELMRHGGVSRPTALVLADRAVPPEGVESFLRPALRDLSDPYELPGILPAVARLWQGIRDGERILIHGDYDADGITAAVLLASVLRENGGQVDCFLPHRIDDGYGLRAGAIERAAQDGYRLVVTVDCGITSYEAAERARQLQVDLIVTDHHEPGTGELTAVAVVDPKLPGCAPALADLAGVGVAFKVCHALLKFGREKGLGGFDTDLRQYLDLVAVGTVADIVPLLGENRSLVRHGLAVLARQQRPGIHALCEIAGVRDPLSSRDITFKLAPRLNAAGRMGDPRESMRLLEARSMSDAMRLARVLDQHNLARQKIEEEAVTAAEQQIATDFDLARDRALVVWHRSWHQGVLGIVASRLVRRYNRPCIVLTQDTGGQWVGSGRSVRHLNLVSIMDRCRDCLLRFGGHAMAAGLALEADQLPAFRIAFEAAVAQILGPDAMKAQLDICGTVSLAEMTGGVLAELEELEPFGHSNTEPVFLADAVWPERKELVGGHHTRGVLRAADGARLGFIAFSRQPDDFPPPPWAVAYQPQLNRFSGRVTPQARIVAVRGASAPLS